MTTNRRTFLKAAAAAVAASSLSTASAEAAPQTARTLDPALLAALGESILPESLGAAARKKIVAGFATWIAGYKPVTEEMHGYGDQEITYTPADPLPNWSAQLNALDLLAQRRHRRRFAALSVAKRRDVVQANLARIRTPALPGNPLAAPHVAVALLSFWAASSEATDLAYDAQINKGTCRVLAVSPRKPLPLAPRAG